MSSNDDYSFMRSGSNENNNFSNADRIRELSKVLGIPENLRNEKGFFDFFGSMISVIIEQVCSDCAIFSSLHQKQLSEKHILHLLFYSVIHLDDYGMLNESFNDYIELHQNCEFNNIDNEDAPLLEPISFDSSTYIEHVESLCEKYDYEIEPIIIENLDEDEKECIFKLYQSLDIEKIKNILQERIENTTYETWTKWNPSTPLQTFLKLLISVDIKSLCGIIINILYTSSERLSEDED